MIDIDDIVLESEYSVTKAMYEYTVKEIRMINYIIQEAVGDIPGKLRNAIKKLCQLCRTLIRNIINRFKKLINKFRRKNSIELSEMDDTSQSTTNNTNDGIVIGYNIDKLDEYIELVRSTIENEDYTNDQLTKFNVFEHIDDKFKYSGSKMQLITHCINQCGNIGNMIDKIDHFVDNTDNTEGNNGKKVENCYIVINSINRILDAYSNIHRSVSGIVDNTNTTTTNIIDKYRISSTAWKYNAKEDNDLPDEIYQKIKRLALTIRETKSYDEYKSARYELLSMLHMPTDQIIAPGSLDVTQVADGYILIRTTGVSEYKRITLHAGTRLYHTTTHNTNGELYPSYKGSPDRHSSDSLYPSNRVYFFIGNPGHRIVTDNSRKFVINDDETRVYEYIVKRPMKVRIDTEASHSAYRKAVFIETNDPIPVTDVTDKFKEK